MLYNNCVVFWVEYPRALKEKRNLGYLVSVLNSFKRSSKTVNRKKNKRDKFSLTR